MTKEARNPNDEACDAAGRVTIRPQNRNLAAHSRSGTQHGLHRKLTMILPLPFGRGEGRSEGSRSAVYPTVPAVFGFRHSDSLRVWSFVIRHWFLANRHTAFPTATK